MSTLDEFLSKVTSLLERAGIDYMVIGGYALPSYGTIRSSWT
ncbi:MAG: hypothetical protein QXG05_08585 [Nitrososphaerota archaeon]